MIVLIIWSIIATAATVWLLASTLRDRSKEEDEG